MDIWNTCPDAYIAAIVTDEDATTHSKLSHSMSELVAAGRMTKVERQYLLEKVGNLGGKRPNSGVIPLEHPYIIKHSDPIYYIKNYKSELYLQVYLLKSKSETCKADAMRLSRNMSYMMGQQRPGRGNVNCTFENVGTLPNGYVRASPLPRLTNTRVPQEQITSTPSTCKPAGHTGRMSVRIHRPVATWPHNNSIAIRANHSLGNRSNRLIIV
jgi:hypothetical protein